ncbi:uncharacterized protein F4812DRAFT_361258 [Daldinia caldariorum]|uniref:uncharacterized protein n=1 Tax=Daldinia caldariorum TaxID=326644 RepID=UPI0020089C70|nr:uncharacterized protein F4812DRAFT_361258 [Daldinia caldariorum]KAI1468295.1 hypothetical protein F4812DRAFT_361258 [Daldinia caldariorum]
MRIIMLGEVPIVLLFLPVHPICIPSLKGRRIPTRARLLNMKAGHRKNKVRYVCGFTSPLPPCKRLCVALGYNFCPRESEKKTSLLVSFILQPITRSKPMSNQSRTRITRTQY